MNPVGAGVDVAAVAGVDVAAGDGACPHAAITSEAAKRLRAPVVEMDRHLVVELPVIPAPFQPCLRARGSSLRESRESCRILVAVSRTVNLSVNYDPSD